MRKHRKDREADRAKDRADYALAQLKVERDIRCLFKDLETARREISPLYGEVSSLRIQTERLKRERKHLMEVLELGGFLYRWKKARTDCTGGDAPRKT